MSADISLSSAGCCSHHGHNVTHNLGRMFREAGLDWHDYRDAEKSGKPLTASYLGREVTQALDRIIDDREAYRPFEASNGWGTYEQAVVFLARLALDCARHPDAVVSVSL